jgi:protein TonB
MDPKKTEKANLANKSALFFNIGLVLTLLIVNMAFTHKVYDNPDLIDLENKSGLPDEIVDVPITVQPPPPPPAIKLPQLIEVRNDEKIEDLDLDMDIEISNEATIDAVVAFIPEPEKEVVEEIVDFAEVDASFPGGTAAFYKHVGNQQNGKYPAQARRMGIEGKVFVKFVVNKDGSIQDVTVIKGIGAGCDELAAKVIQESPTWKPAKQRGVPVRKRMVIPIYFKLN